MAYRGNFKPAIQFIADEINKQSKIRDYIQGEKFIQRFFLAYLNITDFYLSLSEEERNKGYADAESEALTQAQALFTITPPLRKFLYQEHLIDL